MMLIIIKNQYKYANSNVKDTIYRYYEHNVSYYKVWVVTQKILEHGKSFQILPKILLALKESNLGPIIEWYHKMVDNNKALREYFAFGALIDEFQYYRPIINA